MIAGPKAQLLQRRALPTFHLTDVRSKHSRIRRRGVQGRNARDQIAFCAHHTFLMNAGYVHATHA